MKVKEVKVVEDCFDGSFIREFILDEPTSEDFIKKLSQDAILEYYKDFPRPLFKIKKKKAYEIKGVIGNKSVRVIFSRYSTQEHVKDLIQKIEKL